MNDVIYKTVSFFIRINIISIKNHIEVKFFKKQSERPDQLWNASLTGQATTDAPIIYT